jgi:hypothetical protein
MARQFLIVLEGTGAARMARSAPALGAVLFFTGVIAGCGKADLKASFPDGGNDGSAEALLQGVFKAYCAAARSCCAQAGISTTELSDCETQAPTHADLTRLVDMGEMTIDVTAIPACEAAYRQAATTCTTAQILTACRGMFVGLQGENEPCSDGLACKSTGEPQVCVFVGSSSTLGSCQRIVHGTAGGPCGSTCWSSEDCWDEVSTTSTIEAAVTFCFEADGLFCPGYPPRTCVPLTAIGESCIIDTPVCGSLNYCDSSSTCRPAATLGQPCTSSAECVRSLGCGPDKKCVSWAGPFAEPVFACRGYPYGL